eukprot:scaffold8469_cov112-Isochrysis_galbana.AAC.7
MARLFAAHSSMSDVWMGKARVRPVFASDAVRNVTAPVAGCRTRSARTVTDCDSARERRGKAASQPTTRGRQRSRAC